MKKTLPTFSHSLLLKARPRLPTIIRSLAILLIFFGLVAVGVFGYKQITQLQKQKDQLETDKSILTADLHLTSQELQTQINELEKLKNEDQFKRNETLQKEITDIQNTYQQSLISYETILDLRGDGAKVQSLEAQFSLILSQLSKKDYSSANASLQKLNDDIKALQAQLAAAEPPVPENVPSSNTPPAAGYSRQAVETEIGRYQVDILSADLGSTRVVVETASSGDCRDNCPVSSLADFVSRAGGFAGINGPYFCPAEYPSCAGKTNSFDTLLMNKNKVYFNSENNVYSSVPAFIFSGGARLVGKSQEWGRDTGVDSVIASQPMLLSGGNITFGGDGDPKKGSRGSRSFIGTKDNTVYIGVVRGATVAEVAYVLKALGLQNALNLDSGGSTAFMVNGRYVAGPGRNTPFGIVLVRR